MTAKASDKGLPREALDFVPHFQSRIWGGVRLRQAVYAHTPWAEDVPADCGESWLLSAHDASASVVATGAWQGTPLPELLKQYPIGILGKRLAHKYGTQFPLMVKLLATHAPLSIQVHPDDRMAMKKHGSRGKSECWYIMDATAEANLYLGFARKTSKQTYRAHLASATLADVLRKVHPAVGDVLYVPAGCIHSLGKGLLLMEIQQSAQITYRIEDFGRTQSGVPRTLHRAEAEDALDFSAQGGDIHTAKDLAPNTPHPKVLCPHFRVYEWRLTRPLQVQPKDECVLYACVAGTLEWQGDTRTLSIPAGALLLVPAAVRAYALVPQPTASVLEIHSL